ALATALAKEATAAVPTPLVGFTVQAAALFAAGKTATAEVISGHAVALAEGVRKAMFLNNMKTAAALFLTIALLGAAGVTVAYRALAGEAADRSRADVTAPASEEKGGPPGTKEGAGAKSRSGSGGIIESKPSGFGGSGFGCSGGGMGGFGSGFGFSSGGGFGGGGGVGGGGGGWGGGGGVARLQAGAPWPAAGRAG